MSWHPLDLEHGFGYSATAKPAGEPGWEERLEQFARCTEFAHRAMLRREGPYLELFARRPVPGWDAEPGGTK